MNSPSIDELREEAQRWLSEDPDPVTREELKKSLVADDIQSLREGFAQSLHFGTAGLRGVLGPGPGRMNRALVRRVSCGLGRYLLQEAQDARSRGVVVGYDGRHMSKEFALDVAEVLAGLGITVHFFTRLSPTPLVAVAVRALGAAAGVMVTASHNPPQYNGYKVYWGNGAQIIPPHDTGIAAKIDEIQTLQEVPLAVLKDARRAGLVQDIEEKIFDDYLDDVLRLRRHPEQKSDLSIVYTPLHGVGGSTVVELFRRAGYAPLHLVKRQFEPDGDFPTVRFPNPEEEGAMDLALDLAKRTSADLVLANDPDADRLAVALPDGEGEYRMLSGDQVGAILAHYLLSENLPADCKPLLMTTIVSSRLLSTMARAAGAAYAETLTGFKWIANGSQKHRRENAEELLLGYEEALGYSVGMVTADKDGISAALLFAELTSFYRAHDRSVLQVLEEIYRRFGLHLTLQKSMTMPGESGAARIASIMTSVRENPPQEFGAGLEVSLVHDYLSGERQVLREEEAPPAARGEIPRANVLAFYLSDGSRILLRPSGTEPKIKFYFELIESVPQEEALKIIAQRAESRMTKLVDGFMRSVESL